MVAPNGEEKYYRGTDNLKSVAYQGLTPLDLNDIIAGNVNKHPQHQQDLGVFHNEWYLTPIQTIQVCDGTKKGTWV